MKRRSSSFVVQLKDFTLVEKPDPLQVQAEEAENIAFTEKLIQLYERFCDLMQTTVDTSSLPSYQLASISRCMSFFCLIVLCIKS